MGWISTYVGKGRNRKELLENEIYGGHIEHIDYVEIKGSNIWVIGHNDNGVKYGVLFLTKYTDGEFGWKDIGIEMHPFYFNCSKKFVNMVKEIYGEEDTLAMSWIEEWQKENEKDKARKNLIKSLKVGDTIEFTTANYAGQKRWTISRIVDNLVLFEGYKLKGWKQQEFKIV